MMTMSNKEAVGKLLKLLAEYKKIIFLIIGCLIFSAALNLCIPLLSKSIMDDGFIGGNKDLLIRVVLISAAIYLLDSFLDVVKEKKRIEISARLEYHLAKISFRHLMKLKPDYFSKTNYAETLSNINTDIGNIGSIADGSMFFLVTQIFSIAGGIIGLFMIDYKLTVLVLLFIPCKYVIMKHIAKKRKRYMDEFIEKLQDYSGWFGDTVGGVHEVKQFNILKFKDQEFDRKQKSLIDRKKKMNMLGTWNVTIDVIMVHMLVLTLYILGANLVFRLQLSVGGIFAFITYSAYVTGPISGILNIGYMLSGVIPSTKRFYQFMDLAEEVEGPAQGLKPQPGDIEFKDVSFAYDQSRPVVEKTTLRFPRGSKMALIGKNGSGKSTVIGLITRMYRPDRGAIRLGGTDIGDFSIAEYREMISLVSQRIYLFNDTIRNNICLYKEVGEEEILSAVADSGLGDFVSEVTLDYMVGQNGSLLSGGQKQKIAMARALVHDAPIVILDEATSSADVYSEMQINGLLHTRLKEKTVIVVTHKQEILKEVDAIIFLGEKDIVHGTFQELCQGRGDFKEMVDRKRE